MKMVKYLLTIITYLCCTAWITAQDSHHSTGDLTVVVTDLDPGQGSLVACLVDQEAHFLKACMDSVIVHADDQQIQFLHFREVPFGHYAISIYQDANGNHQLDEGLFRIPRERFGFSNNPRLKFAPPIYSDCLFPVESPQDTVTIHLRRLLRF